jgi:hypothetical protein
VYWWPSIDFALSTSMNRFINLKSNNNIWILPKILNTNHSMAMKSFRSSFWCPCINFRSSLNMDWLMSRFRKWWNRFFSFLTPCINTRMRFNLNWMINLFLKKINFNSEKKEFFFITFDSLVICFVVCCQVSTWGRLSTCNGLWRIYLKIRSTIRKNMKAKK